MEGNEQLELPIGDAGEVEQQARKMGWVPREEFRGDQSHWVEADVFVERGNTMMPILRATNRRLEEQLERQRLEMEQLRNNFNASQEAISELKQVHTEATKIAVERAREEMKARIKAARQEGDIDGEEAAREALDELNQTVRDNAKSATETKKPDPATPVLHPEWNAWHAENLWFGTDERKTLRAMGIAQELRADPENDTLVGRKFFERVVEVMNQRTGSAAPASKVGEARTTSGGGSGGSGRKSYSDMPADARETCDRQGKKLVGEGRAFKDMSAWRSYYANLYFQE